jgi:antiviral defense system Shedu protein SduA
MFFDKFTNVTKKYWSAYLQDVVQAWETEQIVSDGEEILYPTILLCTETRQQFVAELIGASKIYTGLSFKHHKEPSIDRYLNQFNTEVGDPVVFLNTEGNGFRSVCLAQSGDWEEVQKRFPFVQNISSRLVRSGGRGGVFAFGESFKSAKIDDCILVNRYLGAVRVKHILHMTIVRKSMLAKQYEQWLRKFLCEETILSGVLTCKSDRAQDYMLAGQFANIFLFNRLRETTIGEFLKTNPEIIIRAIGTKQFVYEPYLLWVDGPPENTDPAINPDLLIERDDGYYDIYELKTAVLDRESITKGMRRRRRFIDYVEEGIAQLSNYAEYFKYSKNRQFALEKYNIRVDNPNLVLVVGNMENADKAEVEEACRRLNRITIIDYDSLMQLFLRSD